ncbi:EF-hand domain-containing family member C2, partial [Megalops cyprinoides]|uniref:EF-hand domain-containing family member C2 n=1 Tax=Megalops cyprinoides TaxID=118141 RepID=UPI0018651D01
SATVALPKLPGYSPNKNLGKEKFHKSQHFDYAHGVPFLVGFDKPGIGGELLLGQKSKPKFSSEGGSNVPSWLAFDKQVLCFDAHFQEPVCQRREETYRVRKCKIFLYLEDSTIQVVEPEVKNSGISQGTLIRRQRIPLPPPDDGQFYTAHHFNINQQVVLLSRTFTITDCDPFTLNFLRKQGVRVNPPVTTPEDPYTSLRKEMEDSMKPLRPYERQDTLRQFLDYDQKVLRFFCYWDDPDSKTGGRRELVLCYFLSDDTIDIREVFYRNSGRDNIPKFLNRSKLPKNAPAPKRQPGEITDRTVLNVFGPMGHKGRYLLDNLKTGAIEEEFYKDSDLTLGAVVNVWGRKVVLCDCDNFTKEFYRSKYGIEDFTPIEYKAGSAPKQPREVPPYNGFGSEEDSLCSCQGLLLKPPKKDFKKMMEKDRQGLVSHVLQFIGKMVSDNPVDTERLFIISYYLSDDTISVYERTQRNLGVMGGKFMERGRVKKPRQELFKSELSEYFKAQDLYLGARLCMNSQEFELVDADEYTMNYMEQNAEEFSMANVGTILSKLKSLSEDKQKEVRQFLAMSDPGNTGVIQYESFRSLLAGEDFQLSEHEIRTLARSYAVQEQRETDLGLMLAMAQEQLKKNHFESFADMTKAFVHEDRDRTGWLSTGEARIICKAFKIPVADELLSAIFKKFENEGGELDYHAFIARINWKENPLPPVLPDDVMRPFSTTESKPRPLSQLTVGYSALVQELYGRPEEE